MRGLVTAGRCFRRERVACLESSVTTRSWLLIAVSRVVTGAASSLPVLCPGQVHGAWVMGLGRPGTSTSRPARERSRCWQQWGASCGPGTVPSAAAGAGSRDRRGLWPRDWRGPIGPASSSRERRSGCGASSVDRCESQCGPKPRESCGCNCSPASRRRFPSLVSSCCSPSSSSDAVSITATSILSRSHRLCHSRQRISRRSE